MFKQFLQLPVYRLVELYDLSDRGHAGHGNMAFCTDIDSPVFFNATINAWMSLVTGDILSL